MRISPPDRARPDSPAIYGGAILLPDLACPEQARRRAAADPLRVRSRRRLPLGSHAMAVASESSALRTPVLPDGEADVRALSIDTIRGLAMDAVQKANAGHP